MIPDAQATEMLASYGAQNTPRSGITLQATALRVTSKAEILNIARNARTPRDFEV